MALKIKFQTQNSPLYCSAKTNAKLIYSLLAWPQINFSFAISSFCRFACLCKKQRCSIILFGQNGATLAPHARSYKTANVGYQISLNYSSNVPYGCISADHTNILVQSQDDSPKRSYKTPANYCVHLRQREDGAFNSQQTVFCTTSSSHLVTLQVRAPRYCFDVSSDIHSPEDPSAPKPYRLYSNMWCPYVDVPSFVLASSFESWRPPSHFCPSVCSSVLSRSKTSIKRIFYPTSPTLPSLSFWFISDLLPSAF